MTKNYSGQKKKKKKGTEGAFGQNEGFSGKSEYVEVQ